MTVLTPERLQALAAAAVAAPSADNKHMFCVRVRGDTLCVHATPELLSAPLGRRILGLISIGAVIENLELRAGRLGLQVTAQPQPQPNNCTPSLLMSIACREGPVLDDPRERAIDLRRSSRQLFFGRTRLLTDARQALNDQVTGLPETSLVWLDEAATRGPATRLLRLAETERFRNRALHRELFESIRFDSAGQATPVEGIPMSTLGLLPLERQGFALLRYWPLQRALNMLGGHHLIGFRAAGLPCSLAPHLCAITAQGPLESAALAAGRLLERIWLTATSLGASLQIFAAPCLYAVEGVAEVPPLLQRRLQHGWTALLGSMRPMIVFRLGFVNRPDGRSGRPIPSSVLMHADLLEPEASASKSQVEGTSEIFTADSEALGTNQLTH